MRFVAESFERVVVMRDGRVLLDGPPDDVFADSSWPALRVDVPRAATARTGGARMGLGTTPTEASARAALAARTSRANGAAAT